MSKYRKGQKVVSCTDIGGVMRPRIPAGTPGIVIDGPLLSDATVQFTLENMFGGRRTETTRVFDHEVC